jgi:hypothetical protein
MIIQAELYYNTGSSDTSKRHVERNEQVFQLVRIFKTIETISLFENLERFMNSEMNVTSNGLFKCKYVPLVGNSYFLNPIKGRNVLDIFYKYHTALDETFSYLINNTSVDIKLFNTYGPSLLFEVDRTNLSLVLDIKFNGLLEPTTIEKLREFIYEFIKSTNFSLSRTRLSISNLITALEKEYPAEIAYIKFRTLNGLPVQSIQNLYTEEKILQMGNFVPEYLNASLIRENNRYNPDIKINII